MRLTIFPNFSFFRGRGRIILYAQLCALLLLSSAYAGSGVSLKLKYRCQEQTNWCWAGASQSVLQYYGFQVSQRDIAAYGTSGANVANYLFGSIDQKKGVDDILLKFGGIRTKIFRTPLGMDQVISELTAGRPFVFRWGWDNGGGHILTGKGFSGDRMEILDPLFGASMARFTWVQRGGGHTWTSSLTTAPGGK